MVRTHRTRGILAALALLALAFTPVVGQAKPGAPPPPPNSRKFPPPSSKPPVARIIRLERGQKQITADQLKKAPSVDAANRRGKMVDARPSAPRSIRVPGAPPILKGLSPHPPKKTPPPAKNAPAKTKAPAPKHK